MSDPTARRRIFVRNPTGDGGPYYMGEADTAADLASLITTLGGFAVGEVESDMGGTGGDVFTLEVSAVWMTDEQLAALPQE